MTYDVIIIGGGPSGLAAALEAGRGRLNTLVLTTGVARNFVTQESHGFLTNDSKHPSEIVKAAVAQFEKYPSIDYRVEKATATEKTEAGFKVVTEKGTYETRRLMIASGHTDYLDCLNLNGIDEVYGKSVYPCPFCDGFEHADETWALFGAYGIEHFMPMLRIWTQNVVTFTNGRAVEDEVKAAFHARGLDIHEAPVKQIISENGKMSHVELETGEKIACTTGFLMDDYSYPSTDFAEKLGATQDFDAGFMGKAVADDMGKTKIDGLYVVGDARAGFVGVTGSVSEGAKCMDGIIHEIAMERWYS